MAAAGTGRSAGSACLRAATLGLQCSALATSNSEMILYDTVCMICFHCLIMLYTCLHDCISTNCSGLRHLCTLRNCTCTRSPIAFDCQNCPGNSRNAPSNLALALRSSPTCSMLVAFALVQRCFCQTIVFLSERLQMSSTSFKEYKKDWEVFDKQIDLGKVKCRGNRQVRGDMAYSALSEKSHRNCSSQRKFFKGISFSKDPHLARPGLHNGEWREGQGGQQAGFWAMGKSSLGLWFVPTCSDYFGFLDVSGRQTSSAGTVRSHDKNGWGASGRGQMRGPPNAWWDTQGRDMTGHDGTSA